LDSVKTKRLEIEELVKETEKENEKLKATTLQLIEAEEEQNKLRELMNRTKDSDRTFPKTITTKAIKHKIPSNQEPENKQN
jgi:hypothetical protein